MQQSNWPNPLIEQRADPFIYRHSDGYYYFTASVPEYDRLEIRRATSLSALAQAEPVTVWHKHEHGEMSALIWAPELHRVDDKWLLYFAAAPSQAIRDNLFQHRMFALECTDANPLTGQWRELGRIHTHLDTFSLDATHFEHQGKSWYLWAQKDPQIAGNSNLYLAELATPSSLKTAPVMIAKPELDWEIIGFKVNEGPAFIRHGERLFITYSASATDENYCIGLLWAWADADILDPAQWHKLPEPVFRTQWDNRQFGPGHNSFTTGEQGEDILVYHARPYTEITGDPLYDPNRHTRAKVFDWDEVSGMPRFGEPPADHR